MTPPPISGIKDNSNNASTLNGNLKGQTQYLAPVPNIIEPSSPPGNFYFRDFYIHY